MRGKTRFLTSLVAAALLVAAGIAVMGPPPVWTLLSLPFIGMAAETTTTALIDEALTIIFSKPLHNDIVADSELMSLFEVEMNIKQEETTGGRYVEQGHFWTLPAGAGWRMDDEYIPEAVSASFKNTRIYLKKFQVTLQMSGDTMRRVRGDEGAFLNYMQQAKPAVVERANQELDLAYIGFGSGIKAIVDGNPTDNGDGTMTFAVKDHSGVTGFTEAWLAFLEGENLVFGSSAAFTTIRNDGTGRAAKVVDINEDDSEITVEAAAGLIAAVVDGDYITTGDVAGHSGPDSSSVARQMSGLMAGVDDGNILADYNNIDRTDTGTRLWRSVVVDSTAGTFTGELTEDLLNYAMRTANLRGGAKTDYLVMSYSARDSYWKAMKGDRFFIDPGGNYRAGRGRLEVVLGDRVYPLKVARKLPPEVCFGLQKDRWARLTLGQLVWEEETGSMWNRVTDSTGRKDSYYAAAHMYEQLYCAAPRKQFRIDNLTPVT